MKKIFFSLLAVVLCSLNTFSQSADMIKMNARAAITAIANHDFKTFLTYIADDAVDYGMGPGVLKGKTAISEALMDFFKAFPDYKVSIESVSVDGDKAYVQNTFTGTHTGTLAGVIPPTNKWVEWKDVDVMQFNKNGKIIGHWVNNPNAILDQIGYHAFTNPAAMAVMKGYEMFGKGDVKGVADACTEDVKWDVTDNPSSKIAKVYTGKKEAGEFFKGLAGSMQITKFEPYKFFADGDEVVAFINTEYKMDGKMYKATLVHYFVIKNGMIASFKEVTDKPMMVGGM